MLRRECTRAAKHNNARLSGRLLASAVGAWRPSFGRVRSADVLPKGTLRKAGSRTKDALVEATGRALDAITSEDIRGFYADCGYRLPLQSL